MDDAIELLIGNEGKDGTLQWRNEWWEGEVCAGGFLRAYLEAVLEDAIDDSADTEGGFNDRGCVLLLVLGPLTLLKGNEVFIKLHLFTGSECEGGLTSRFELLHEFKLVLIARLIEEIVDGL